MDVDITIMENELEIDEYTAEAVFTAVSYVLPPEFVERYSTASPTAIQYKRMMSAMKMGYDDYDWR